MMRCAHEDCGEGECKGEVEVRHSLGIYAGRWCHYHWHHTSGYRKEGKEGYSWFDAGEEYESDDW